MSNTRFFFKKNDANSYRGSFFMIFIGKRALSNGQPSILYVTRNEWVEENIVVNFNTIYLFISLMTCDERRRVKIKLNYCSIRTTLSIRISD